MDFIDNNGKIFSIKSSNIEPIGYEYDNKPYIFWIDSINDNKLSINNYYIKTINILLEYNKNIEYNINIKIDSKIFYLLSSKQIKELLSETKSLDEKIAINESTDFYKELKLNTAEDSIDDDLISYAIEDENSSFLLIPLYIICFSELPGTWTTNILITSEKINSKKQKLKEWCPICVGGEFADLSEELIINGENMGIKLPREIIKAVYQESFYNDTFNEQLYNEKLKEYLLNFMNIKGEIGNFRSVENSLAWFGYNDKIKLSKLYQTDNEFKNQFIRDYFNIKNDIMSSFKTFRNSTYISLNILLNHDTDKINNFNFNNDLYGEGHPEMESLINKFIISDQHILDNNPYKYIKLYYDYSFTELGLKLTCLKYYFEKYFLPIHLSIHSASLTEKTYMNDIKMISNVNTQLSENTFLLGDTNNEVEFYPNNDLYFTHQIHYVDDFFNEYTNYSDNNNLININDTCVNIPIKFNSLYKLYNCVLLLTKDINNDNIKYPYQITINYPIQFLSTIEIYDRYENKLNLNNIYFSYSIDKKNYSTYYYGIDKLIKFLKISNKKLFSTEYEKNNINIDGKLICKFDKENNKYKYYIKYNLDEYEIKNEEQYIYIDSITIIIPKLSDININVFNKESASCYIYIINDFYLKLKFDDNIISKIILNDHDITGNIINRRLLLSETGINSKYDDYIGGDLIQCENNNYIELENSYQEYSSYGTFIVNFLPSSEVIYESHFSFFQTEDNKYANFIIYPKLLNKENNITYFINNKFNIHLLVNNKWYNFNFKLKIPESIIDLGTLEYNYWNNSNNYQTNFSQIKKLEYNSDKTPHIEFNSFIYEDSLINVNNINFYDNYLDYVINNNLKYINGQYINEDDFYYSIQFNNETIKIHKSIYKKDFIVLTENLNKENQIYIYKNITGDYLYLLKTESDNNEFIVEIPNNIGIELEYDGPKYIVFKYDEELNKYIVETDTELIYLDIVETMHFKQSDFFNKYISNINIGNNNKYLNNIHLFDIYKKYEIKKEIPILTNNSLIYYKGLKFYHNNYSDKDKIYIEGILNNNERKINDKNFSYINVKTKEKLNNLSSYEISTKTDYDIFAITDDNLVESSSYAYYENPYETDETKKYTSCMCSLLHTSDEIFGVMYFDTFNDIKKLSDNIDTPINLDINLIEDKYKKYINNVFCDKSGNLYLIKNLNDNYNFNLVNDKFNIKLNLEFIKKINNTWQVIDITNIDYLKLYNKININKADNYKIKATLIIEEAKLVNNKLHFIYNNDIPEYAIKLNTKKYKINNKELLFPYIYPNETEIANNDIIYENNQYFISEKFNTLINSNWKNNMFCKELNIKSLLNNKKEKVFKISSDISENMKKNNIMANVNICILDEKDNEIIIGENTNFTLTNNIKAAYIFININNIKPDFEFSKIKNTDFIIISLNEIKLEYKKFKYDIKELNDNIFCDININNKIYKYGDNSSIDVYNLYNIFFDKYNINNKFIYYNKPELNLINMKLDYDFYLMHDDDYWYGLYISKQTINKVASPLELQLDKLNYTKEIDNYFLKHIKSSNEFLINRMKYIPANGINKFNNNDLIVAHLSNNERLPVNIFQSPKWKITPMSLGINEDSAFDSSAEMCIFSLPKSNNKYYKGYYDITVKYCIDKYIQHQYKNQTKLLIK